jgi:hypothetical protein
VPATFSAGDCSVLAACTLTYTVREQRVHIRVNNYSANGQAAIPHLLWLSDGDKVRSTHTRPRDAYKEMKPIDIWWGNY